MHKFQEQLSMKILVLSYISTHQVEMDILYCSIYTLYCTGNKQISMTVDSSTFKMKINR